MHRYRHSILGLACVSRTRGEESVPTEQVSEKISASGDGPPSSSSSAASTASVTVSSSSSSSSKPVVTAPPHKKSEGLSGRKLESGHTEVPHPHKPRVILANNMEPQYYIGGGNGNALIEETLNELGWKRTRDKLDENYRLKWCELKGTINYNTFREGEQIVNHIPNCQLLTNKMGLLNSLQEYDRVCVNVKNKPSRLDFIPQTYKLDDVSERQCFFDFFKEGDLWICKPTANNQGKGIFLVRDTGEVKKLIADNESLNQTLKAQGKPLKSLNRIIQRYIANPLLLDGRKFDIRAYMLIANTVPYLVLYHKGYVRLCMHEYEEGSENLVAHLTNQFIQKKDPMYKESKEETVWSMDRFNKYVNEKIAKDNDIEQDWVYNSMTNRMKQIMTYCFNAVKGKLQCKTGYFDLYGLDFMVDQEMKVWLIEVNVNPCLATNCEALRQVVPSVVKETLRLAVECFEKSRKSRPLMPLNSLNGFKILYNGSPRIAGVSRHRSVTSTPSGQNADARIKSVSPVRRTRSLSPVKEATDTKVSKPLVAQRHTPKATATTTGTSKPQDRSAPRQQDRQPGNGAVPTQGVRPLRDRVLAPQHKQVPVRSTAPFKERSSQRGIPDTQSAPRPLTVEKTPNAKSSTNDKKLKDKTSSPTLPQENKSANNNIIGDGVARRRMTYINDSPVNTSKVLPNTVTLKMTHGQPLVRKKSKPLETKSRGS